MDFESLASKFSLYREISSYEQKKISSDTNSSSKTDITPKETPNSENSDATVSRLGDGGFSSRLYKHISDYYAGEGRLSKDTNREIVKKDNNASNILNIEDPKSGGQYSAYKTAGFAYGTKARFISGVESSAKLSTNIRKIYKA
jgi:hypothetical protein